MLEHDVVKGRASIFEDLRKRGLSRFEVLAGLFALAFVCISGGLYLAQVVGPWVLAVGGAISAVLGVMRYRAESRQKRGEAGDRAE
jgi:hypothetical protein